MKKLSPQQLMALQHMGRLSPSCGGGEPQLWDYCVGDWTFPYNERTIDALEKLGLAESRPDHGRYTRITEAGLKYLEQIRS